jgi:hypothetical protein
MGGADDEGAVEAAINRSGERDGGFSTNASAADYVPSRAASGRVRQVRFLDAEVAYWQTAAAHYMVNGTLGAPPPRATAARALDGTRLLVAVADSKVVLYDLLSKKPFEVTKAQLDGRSPTSVAFLFRGGPHAPGGSGAADPAGSMMASPVLAVGCSDGVVRLVHLATLRVVGRLAPGAGYKASAVTALLVLPSRQGHAGATGTPAAGPTGGGGAAAAGPTGGGGGIGGGAGATGLAGGGPGAVAAAAAAATPGASGVFVPSRDLLLVGDASGGLFLYDPFGRPLSAGREAGPTRAVEAHAGGVWSLCLAPGPEDDSETAPRVFSCGADKHVAAWEPHALREMWRLKLDPKAPAASLAYSHRCVVQPPRALSQARRCGPGRPLGAWPCGPAARWSQERRS